MAGWNVSGSGHGRWLAIISKEDARCREWRKGSNAFVDGSTNVGKSVSIHVKRNSNLQQKGGEIGYLVPTAVTGI